MNDKLHRYRILRFHYLFALLPACALLWLCSGCHTVKPTIQSESIRPGLNKDWHSAFEESRKSIVAGMARDKIPGISMAVVDRDGLLWIAGFGHTDYDCKTPVTPDTIFSIQSMSKTFTATAVMLAVQDGLVDLDTPITEYLPDFKVKSRFEENPEKKITLRHLLSHTAGFVQFAPVGNYCEPKPPSFEAQHIRSISDTWLKFPVGAKYSYSSIGFDLAAYIIQKRSGQSFSKYMKAKLFDPLGMTNSSVDMSVIKQHPNRAIGHQNAVAKVPLDTCMMGSAGVYTSANDLARFIQMFLNWGDVNEHSILHRGSIETMYTSSAHVLRIFIHDNVSYGLGIGVNPDYTVSTERYPSADPDAYRTCALDHTGGGFGFCTIMTWLPEYGIGALCLSNCGDDNSLIVNVTYSLIDNLLVHKLVKKDSAAGKAAWQTLLTVSKDQHRFYRPPDPSTFTHYRPEWKKYIGTYRPLQDWKLTLRGHIGIALGTYNVGGSVAHVKVRERDGYLTANGKRLDEYRPGVFFTKEGDYLDFSGSLPIWSGVRMKKE